MVFSMLLNKVFYELLPHMIHVQGGLQRRGKWRLMIVLFCYNALWSEEMRPLVTGKSVNTQGFRDVHLLPSDDGASIHVQRA